MLGSIEVFAEGDGSITLGGPKQRAVLAHLLLRANHLVPAEVLIDEVWGEEPPETARNALQSYASHLRKVLGTERLEGSRAGYRLRAEPSELDATRFQSLLRDARRLLPIDASAAVGAFDRALALWRGPAFADLASEPSLRGEAARLDDLRLGALEDRIEAQITIGHHGEAIGELESLTARHPLRERFWEQLMLALYRSGRQGEALGAFQRAREILAEELGIDPSPELRHLHERILAQSPDLDASGEPLRGYRLLERVGAGSFGTVWRAIQPEVGRDVAVKAIHSHLANDPDFIRRFEAEAQLVARLEHPHIVPLYDFWREPGGAYLVMRFLRGGDLADALERGPFELDRTARLIDQIAGALAASHREGVVHRDVKPSNILLDEEGNAYLADFGIAKILAATEMTEPGALRGSLLYAAPEQVRGETVTSQTDVCALGIILHEALAGRHPFADVPDIALLERQLREPLPSVSEQRAELPPAVDDVIATATAKDPQARFPDALSMASAFRAAIASTLPVVPPKIPVEVRNPYKGLRPFGEADAGDFFGREAFLHRLLERLSRSDGASRFVAVVGPSGSGKSSVVSAGLVAAVRGGALPGSERWFVTDMHPGRHPFEELDAALMRVAIRPPAGLLARLESGARGLLDVANSIAPEDTELLLIVDQFEEVFTLTENEAERALLLESLRVATADPTSRVHVVATLRADFYDRPLRYPRMGPLLGVTTEVLSPLTPEELERAIVRPAERSGLAVDSSLVAQIAADVAAEPGALPLVQYALTELYDRRQDGRLTLEAYREIGGVGGALAARAEHLYATRNQHGREAVRQLFLRLVTLGEGTTDTRRRVPLSELSALEIDVGEMESALDAYGRHRLLTFDRDPSTREPTVEVAHEAFLGEWERLRGWIDRAREDVQMRRRLSEAARDWGHSGLEPSFLLTGSRLDQFRAWGSDTSLALGLQERGYLTASITRREEERAVEAARRDRERALERRSVKRLRALVSVFAIAALVAATLTVVAMNQSDRAEEASRVASARELAAAAVANLEVDPERSILLALEAIRTTRSIDSPVLREAEEALHRAIQESRIVTRLNVTAAGVAFSPDGTRLATAGGNPDAIISGSAPTQAEQETSVWDLQTGQRVLTLSGHRSRVWDVHFSPDGARLVTSDEDGAAEVWDAETGERLLLLPGHSSGFRYTYFSPDGSEVLTAREDGVVQRWDALDGGLEPGSSGPSAMCGGVFSPEGNIVAGASCKAPETAFVLDAVTGRRILALEGHTQPIFKLAFSPDGSQVATGSVDKTAKVWDARTGRELFTLEGHGGWVFGVDFSPDGRVVATASEDGTTRLWDASTGRELLVLSGHTGIVGDVEFSPDGTHLATGGADGTVRVWDIGPQGSRELATLSGQAAVDSVSYGPDGERLATTSLDGKARLWDPATGRRILTFFGGDAGHDAAFAPDGQTLITVGVTGPPILWDTASGALNRILDAPEGFGSVAFSPDGTLIAEGLGETDQGNGQVLLWESSTGRPVGSLGELAPEGHMIDDIAFSPDGKLLAAAMWDGTARVWDLASRVERLSIPAHATVIGVAFSPDGRLLATAGTDGMVKLWNVSTGAEVRSLAGHLGTVVRVAFSPDGRRLASAGFDGTARLWDVSTGRELLVLTGHSLGLTDLAFSPDGTRIATSATDGTVRIYVLPIDELIDLARSRLTRSWTEDECRQYLHLPACPQSG